MWFVYVGLFVLFLLFLDDWLLDKRQFKLTEAFNGPRRLPIVGNLFLFLKIEPKGETQSPLQALSPYLINRRT
jgi:hypothetical protein